MSYVPLSGTAPARAIAYLKTLPPGKEVSTAELAEAIDYDKGCMSSSLSAAKKFGLVVGRIPQGVLYTMWSAGKGVPLPAPADADDDGPIDAAPAPAAPPTTARSVFDSAAPSIFKSRDTRAPEPRPIRFALWSDGALQIERDGCDNVLLAPDQTEAMFAYLDRLREREVAA